MRLKRRTPATGPDVPLQHLPIAFFSSAADPRCVCASAEFVTLLSSMRRCA